MAALSRVSGISHPFLWELGSSSIRFKMLTYFVYAPLLNRIDALPLNVSYIFEMDSNLLTILNLYFFIF
jgi:hypothetical protein